MTGNDNEHVEKARSYARDVVRRELQELHETAEATASMYEYDAIYTDDDACGVGSVSIMVDMAAGTFALVDNPAPAPENSQRALPSVALPTNLADIDWEELEQEHALAYLRGDLATSSPESYSLEEMREISEGMSASSAAVEAALRADFESLSPQAQDRMLDLLKQADPDNFDWWRDLLCGEMPDSPDDVMQAE